MSTDVPSDIAAGLAQAQDIAGTISTLQLSYTTHQKDLADTGEAITAAQAKLSALLTSVEAGLRTQFQAVLVPIAPVSAPVAVTEPPAS